MTGKRNGPRSLRTKMLVFMLVCWLLPVLMVLGSMSFYVLRNFDRNIKEEIAGGLEVGLQIASDRMDSAVSTIRRTAYDGSVRDSWLRWDSGEFGWITLYSRTVGYLGNEYRSNDRFPIVAFWFSENPEEMRVGLYVEAAGGAFRQLNTFWEEDFEGAQELAAGLDTYVGIYENEGRIYLVRNLTNRFEVIGTQVVALKPEAFFDGLMQTAWGQSLTVWLDDCMVVLSGDAPDLEALGLTLNQRTAAQGDTSDGGRYCYDVIEGDGYRLSALIQVDRSVLFGEMRGYLVILLVMFLLLWPMLILYYRLFEYNVTKPMHELMDGARQVEGGALGHQVESEVTSREFRYIIDSFNDMSSKLRSQFEQIYREELSLRDARIKALQSQINPHFLNNTLEIINWEARIEGNAKVSQMIEALSTLLDAAIDRDSRSELRLSEELQYINAWFFIADRRFGKRLTVTQEIAPETLDCMVPRLILQPIVENAIEHGIGPGGHGHVRLRTYLEGDDLVILVENDGKITEKDRERIDLLLSPDYDASKEGAYSMGIANVNQRLRILYAPPSGLTIESIPGGVAARILIAGRAMDRSNTGG